MGLYLVLKKKKKNQTGHQRHSFIYLAAPHAQPAWSSWHAAVAAEVEEDEEDGSQAQTDDLTWQSKQDVSESLHI